MKEKHAVTITENYANGTQKEKTNVVYNAAAINVIAADLICKLQNNQISSFVLVVA